MMPFQAMRLRKSAAPATDPYFANVVSLLHFDDVDGSTTITDQIAGRTWTTTGTATIRTAQSQFGGSSLELLNSAQNRIDCTDSAFNFGTGDFTIECWWRSDAISGRAAFSFGTRLVYVGSAQWVYFNGANRIIGNSLAANTWYHVALTRASGTIYLFVNGTLVGTYAGDSGAINAGAMRIGYFNAGNTSGRYYDEFRCTVGVARYTANFTPSATPFPNS